LFNNVLLVVAAILILMGTLYPLIIDFMGLGKLSVGPPYFAVAFLIPMFPMLFLLVIGMHASWKKAQLERMRKPLLIISGIAVLFALLMTLIAFGQISILKLLGQFAGALIILSALYEPFTRWRNKHRISPAVLGMCIAHLGMGVFVLGVTTVESYKIEKDMTLGAGQSASIGGYEFNWTATRDVRGPNYDAKEAEVHVLQNGKEVAVLHPQKRIYRAQPNPMTEAGIDAHWSHDLLVSMGDELGNGMWSVRLQYKPLVRFIWLGALIMGIGGFIAVLDRRYRAKVPATETVADNVAAARS